MSLFNVGGHTCKNYYYGFFKAIKENIVTFNIFRKSLLEYLEALKGTVSIKSSKPPCKDGNTRFTLVPIKPLSDQV